MKERLGIVGGGQLGRMLTHAARKLGFRVVVLDPTPESPAGQVADQQIVGGFDDPEAIRALAREVDYLTFEIESAHADTLADIAAARPGHVYPLPETLHIIKDKLYQKNFLDRHSIPVASFRAVETTEDIAAAAQELGYPLVMKTRSGGYDGRGNATISSASDIESTFARFAGRDVYVEQFVPFTKELAVVAARTAHGEIGIYPTVETIHEDHICHVVLAPARVPDAVAHKAQELARKTLMVLPGAGVFGIEMFLTTAGEVLINEIAPRVHNSGHFTIEACETSQFEQQVRVVTGKELGSVAMTVPAVAMINILGEREGRAEPHGIEEAEALGNVTVHIYGKKETKPKRKMGHLTVVGADIEEVLAKAYRARACVTI